MKQFKALDPAALRARITGRSWWRVRYSDGKLVDEWSGMDWSLLPRRGLVAVRLYCPNGQVAELGNTVEAGERLFQFKGGMLMGGLRAHTYQLIGLVTGLDGQCTCAVWETGPQRLVTFTDNVHAMQYENVGRLAFDHLGIKP